MPPAKQNISAIARHAITAAGGAGMAAGGAGMAAGPDDITQIVSAFATLFGIIWSLWEKRARMQPPARSPNTLNLFILASLIPFLGGCVNSDSGAIMTVTRAERLTRLAAYISAKSILKKHPELRPQFESARNGFCELVNAKTWDLSTFAAIATANGLAQLQTDEGILIITGAVELLDLFTGTTIRPDLRDEPYARAIIIGACDGLTMATTAPRAFMEHQEDATLEALRGQERACRPLRVH